MSGTDWHGCCISMKWQDHAGKFKPHTQYRNAAGKQIPGVTTVLKNLGWAQDSLMAWVRREVLEGRDPDLIKTESAAVGKAAHYLIECCLKQTDPDLSQISPAQLDFAIHGRNNFVAWARTHALIPHSSEIQVISETYQYGGTIDCLATINGSLDLIDFKTSKGLYAEHKAQTAAYFWAWNEQHPEQQCQRIWVLQIGREHGELTPHLLSAAQIHAGWEVFKLCRQLHELKKAF